MKVALQGIAALLLTASSLALAQQTPQEPTPLSQLLSEAQANNPQIAVSNDTWKTATHKIDQVTTLPDPKFTVQQFSVGSPKPFAGYTNSNFAYIGVGASQDLPFPGKLRLRGEVASRQADALHAQVAITEATIADAVKSDYLQLAYLQQTLTVLEESKKAVDELIQDATIHYQVGQGMQQDVLDAQIQHTDVVRRIAAHHEQVGQIEAQLKELLRRDQQSPDIIAEPLQRTALRLTAAQLLALVKAQNPQVQADTSAVTEQTAAVASAKRETKPDFGLSYMYQNTDRKYRDYYMLTFDMRLPRRKRVNAEIAEATQQLAQSRDTLDAHLQQQLAEVKQQDVRVSSDDEVLTDYSAGLMPQTDAAYRATLSAYSANREQFAHVVSAFVARLNLRLEYLQTLADHESAIARLETLTGASLR
jgi:outer membrane protein TolC